MTDVEARLREMAEHDARRQRLVAEHGEPEHIESGNALVYLANAGARIDPPVTADDIWAAIYRDDAAADAWLESNRVHHGHPALCKVRMDGGLVMGVLDLRPALARAREEAAG